MELDSLLIVRDSPKGSNLVVEVQENRAAAEDTLEADHIEANKSAIAMDILVEQAIPITITEGNIKDHLTLLHQRHS